MALKKVDKQIYNVGPGKYRSTVLIPLPMVNRLKEIGQAENLSVPKTVIKILEQALREWK